MWFGGFRSGRRTRGILDLSLDSFFGMFSNPERKTQREEDIWNCGNLTLDKKKVIVSTMKDETEMKRHYVNVFTEVPF